MNTHQVRPARRRSCLQQAGAPTTTICSRRGPCAPSSSVCSMSAERDGPVMKFDRARHRALAVDARATSRTTLSQSPTMSSANTTTKWLSGRKLSVVGLSGPETSASVPVSATAAKAALTALRSSPVGSARANSSAVVAPRHGGRARIVAHAQGRRQIVVAQNSARSRRERRRGSATSATLAWTRCASALKVASRAAGSPCAARRHDRRRRLARGAAATASRRGASSPVDAERAADRGEDVVARAHCVAPLFARHWLWKVAPCGAAKIAVARPAAGERQPGEAAVARGRPVPSARIAELGREPIERRPLGEERPERPAP